MHALDTPWTISEGRPLSPQHPILLGTQVSQEPAQHLSTSTIEFEGTSKGSRTPRADTQAAAPASAEVRLAAPCPAAPHMALRRAPPPLPPCAALRPRALAGAGAAARGAGRLRLC
jgi:hypothetical protein